MFHFKFPIIVKTLMDGHVVWARNLCAVWKTDFIPCIFSWRLFCPTVGISHYAVVPTRKTSVRNLCLFLFNIEFGLCVLLRCAGCFFGGIALKSSLHGQAAWKGQPENWKPHACAPHTLSQAACTGWVSNGLRRLRQFSTAEREGHWMMRCRVIF